jgi:UrcA family protein
MFISLIRTSVGAVIATAATAAIVVFSAAPAEAATSGTIRSARVETAGIDLATASGRAMVEAQIDRAARSVCAPGNPRDWAEVRAARACTKTAVAAAMPRLDDIAAARSGTQLAAVTSRQSAR